ncbi:hypothetical protein CFC21_112678 [Triticum aestivum]|uniref:Nicotianamine synthase n=2 Tax=Triticum aestivum TaxID=4565 RepID=A0A9R0GL68_WHEAT|nr:hypothetical protein [Triticum aestivum]
MAAQNNKEVDALVEKITGLHAAIAKLPSLSPSPAVDALFTELVTACVPPVRVILMMSFGLLYSCFLASSYICIYDCFCLLVIQVAYFPNMVLELGLFSRTHNSC